MAKTVLIMKCHLEGTDGNSNWLRLPALLANRWSLQTSTHRAAALLRIAISRTWKAVCGLRGHDMVLYFEPQRLSLLCQSCGARTPGWTIDVNPIYQRPRRRISIQRIPRLDEVSSSGHERRYERESSDTRLNAA